MTTTFAFGCFGFCERVRRCRITNAISCASDSKEESPNPPRDDDSCGRTTLNPKGATATAKRSIYGTVPKVSVSPATKIREWGRVGEVSNNGKGGDCPHKDREYCIVEAIVSLEIVGIASKVIRLSHSYALFALVAHGQREEAAWTGKNYDSWIPCCRDIAVITMGMSRTAADVLSGTTGGIAQVMVGQPFDIVKVRRDG